jgi:hypothetical protein
MSTTVSDAGRMIFTVIAAVAAAAGLDSLHAADFGLDVLTGVAAGALMLLYARRKATEEPICAE